MKEGEAATEEEMIAVFLAAELTSSRFPALRDALMTNKVDEALVTDPDLADPVANDARRMLLFTTRGYPYRHLFIGFPLDIRWRWTLLDADELPSILYVNTPPWATTLTDGSRRPIDGAAFVRAHPDDETAQVCNAIARRLAAGEQLPPLIVVGDPDGTRLVVLEGHARLTAMVMTGAELASPIQVLYGTSPRAGKWHLF